VDNDSLWNSGSVGRLKTDLRAVHDVARAAQGVYDTPALLARICASVADSFGFERVAITRCDEDARELEPVAAHGLAREALEALPRSVDAWPLALRALESRELVFEVLGVRTAFAAPLVSQGRCLGFLSAERSGEPASLDDDARHAVTTIAVLTASFLERSLAHDELVRLGQLKSNFIALASHELRTPAAVIHGIVVTLHARDGELNEEQLDKLRAALYEQSARMKTLVDQVLDLSRLEARSIRIEPEPIQVRSRVQELVGLVADEGADAVRVEIPPELETVADPHALDRIVSNLVTNALRYGEAPITISAEQRDRHFRLRVEDRGRGVAPEFVPHLFERFTRGRKSAEVGGAAGLGLSIAQSYAHAHGGELVYEQAKPRGASFELVLRQAK